VQGGDGVLQLDCYFESSLVSCAATGKRAQAEAFGVPANKILIVDAGNFSNCAPHTHSLWGVDLFNHSRGRAQMKGALISLADARLLIKIDLKNCTSKRGAGINIAPCAAETALALEFIASARRFHNI
jgi:hypothetical protein